jgi:hypothetical protein
VFAKAMVLGQSTVFEHGRSASGSQKNSLPPRSAIVTFVLCLRVMSSTLAKLSQKPRSAPEQRPTFDFKSQRF